MKHLNFILSRGLCSLLLAAATFLSAADQPEAKQATARSAPKPDVAAAWQRRIPEMVSDNLPLGEIIKELRHQFPEINFLIKQQTDTEFDVSSFSVKMVLRAVTLQEILKALELAAQRPLQITGGPDERLVVFEAKPAPAAVDASGLPLASIQTRVFNISRYLGSRTEKEAAEAMKELENVLHTAGDMQMAASRGERPFRPRLSLHRGTKLLIAVGRPDELAIVEQVVTELQSTLGQPTLPARPASEPPAGPKQ
jgi:hypothetical protein